MSFETGLKELIETYLVAYAACDPDGCAALHESDGEIHSPFGPPARGRAAIRDWFEEGEDNKAFEILASGARGNLGFVLLRYSADTSEGPEAGTSLNVLRRGTDGCWRFGISSLNADVSVAP